MTQIKRTRLTFAQKTKTLELVRQKKEEFGQNKTSILDASKALSKELGFNISENVLYDLTREFDLRWDTGRVNNNSSKKIEQEKWKVMVDVVSSLYEFVGDILPEEFESVFKVELDKVRNSKS